MNKLSFIAKKTLMFFLALTFTSVALAQSSTERSFSFDGVFTEDKGSQTGRLGNMKIVLHEHTGQAYVDFIQTTSKGNSSTTFNINPNVGVVYRNGKVYEIAFSAKSTDGRPVTFTFSYEPNAPAQIKDKIHLPYLIIDGPTYFVDKKIVCFVDKNNFDLSLLSVLKNLANIYHSEGLDKDVQELARSITGGLGPYFRDDTPKAPVTLNNGSDVKLTIDGNPKGKGNWSGNVGIGLHEVVCERKGYETKKTMIEVKNGTNVIDIEQPTPIYGYLSATSTPSGAKVAIDGEVVGYTPMAKKPVIIGEHRVTVGKSFYTSNDTIIKFEKNRTDSLSYHLDSEIEVKVSSTPCNALLTMNGQPYRTPITTKLPEGTYNINIERQRNNVSNRGICKKSATIYVDSLHQNHTISLKTDNSYDYATFFGLDYDTGLQALGINFGANPGKHFMFEMNFFWGIKKSEDIYWTMLQKASQNNYDLQSFNYSHWAADLRMGPSLWCGPLLRVAPEVGMQYLRLREYAVGDSNKEETMVKGGYFSALGAIRFRLSLSQHFGLQITPEYRMLISTDKTLPGISSDIDKWVNGFSVKGGLVLFF